MNYNSFLKDITQRVQERVSGEYTVEVKPMRKNNGVILDSMMIRRPDDPVCPNIYLNQIYEHYQDGLSMEHAVESILSTYRCAVDAIQIDEQKLINPEIIRKQVVYRLVNYDRNRSMLKTIPHKQFLDLALIYYVMVHHEKMGDGAVMVQNDFLENYSLTLEELDEAAGRNTRKILPVDFLRITDLLREFGEKCGAKSYSDISLEEESVESPLYVLTNKSRQYGAYYMTDTEVLSTIADRLGSDLYILPSSVHECMVVSADLWEETDMLSEMVREINSTQVTAEEYLADTIYRFHQEEKSLRIAV